MRLSRYFIPTLKENPSDADTISAKLMLRSGMIRKVATGLYEWLPLGLRVLRKVESIIRQEMDNAGGLEVWLPHIQPKELWEESGRWHYYGKELLRIRDRKEAEFCFAPTAEEIITDLARREIRSYKELPLMFYQFGTKFRDEIRPRFGIMRAREFLMKDAYSFHADVASLDKTYNRMVDAYTTIFNRLGLTFRPVEADTGTIGGSSSHEFMVLAETGEEQIATCKACGYAANIERAECRVPPSDNFPEPLKELEEVHTPGASRVEEVSKAVGVATSKIIKTVFLIADSQPVVALLRGDTELNEPKLMRLLGAKMLRSAKDSEYQEMADCEVGFAGPMNLKANIVADELLMTVINGVSGARKKDYHLKNVNPRRDFMPNQIGDIRNIRVHDPCPKCQQPIIFFRGIEVGHVFKLGTKYSAALKATALDENGKANPIIMGCYGIGVSRIVAAAIEQNNDAFGICWPYPMAPFELLVTVANISDSRSMEVAERLYGELKNAGVDVLFDDRDLRAGAKFKDADLIGIPLRLTIGEKSLARNSVEFKKRIDEKATEINVDQALSYSLDVVKKYAQSH